MELCSALSADGLTPSLGLLRQVKAEIRLPVVVMIRPRDGYPVYDHAEQAIMHTDIDMARQEGADGIVIGALTRNGEIDTSTCAELVARARPMSVTFHRAFDLTVDPQAALERLIELGLQRVLTSGHAANAEAGRTALRDRIQQARGRLVVMPCGGIRPSNVTDILDFTSATEIHSAALPSSPDATTTLDEGDKRLRLPSVEIVRQLRQMIDRHSERTA